MVMHRARLAIEYLSPGRDSLPTGLIFITSENDAYRNQAVPRSASAFEGKADSAAVWRRGS